jgi:hypothetical protein
LLQLVVGASLPLSFVDNVWFQNFVKLLRPEAEEYLIKRTCIRSEIKKKFTEKREEIIKTFWVCFLSFS